MDWVTSLASGERQRDRKRQKEREKEREKEGERERERERERKRERERERPGTVREMWLADPMPIITPAKRDNHENTNAQV